jgi:large conductance mechanosensitive channel
MKTRTRTFFSEFKEFSMRGNVMDLAIGVVIGTAFGKIVSSLVADVITPPLGVLLGGVDFKHLSVTLQPPVGSESAVTINYGIFLQSVFDFLIIALALFLVIKGLNALKRRFEREQQKGETPKPADILLLEEIRDVLKEKK